MANDKTKWLFDEGDPWKSSDGEITDRIDDPGTGPTVVDNNEPTVELPAGRGATPDKTVIYKSGNAQELEALSDQQHADDPVAGWLVVARGPGQGHSVPLGVGMNSVGRGPDARCSLPFGDTMISADDHVRIIYDDTTRDFFIAVGSGKNISRVNGQLLAATVPLEDGSVIDLSKITKVVFKQFCTKDLDWADLRADTEAKS